MTEPVATTSDPATTRTLITYLPGAIVFDVFRSNENVSDDAVYERQFGASVPPLNSTVAAPRSANRHQ